MKIKGMMVMALVIMASLCSADVVFEEDFESREAYKTRWDVPSSGWSLVEIEVNGRKTTVLDITGGTEGLSFQRGLKDYDFDANFRIVNSGAGFVFGARDLDNLNTLWFPNDQKYFYPRTRTNGGYPGDWGIYGRYHDNAPPLEPLGTEIPLGEWRHIRLKVRGNKIKCFLGERLVGEWEDKNFYQGGRFGFRCGFPHWAFGGEHMQVDNVRITTNKSLQPVITLERSALPRMILAGRSFELKATVQNVGWKSIEDVSATLSLPPGLKVVKGITTQSTRSLKTLDHYEFSWEVKAEKVSTGRMEIAATCNGLPAAGITIDYEVYQPLPIVSDKPAKKAVARVDDNKNVILENQNLRMVFVKDPKGYRAAIIYAYDGKKWRQMAVSQPIGHVAYRTADGEDVESVILPAHCEILYSGGPLAQVRFAAEKVDEDGCRWNFVYTFKLESGKDTVWTHYQGWANKDRQLLYFQGPDLYAGEGSFGGSKSHALLPGVEYLEAGENSSSDRDMTRVYANRYAPHPYKITIPLIAVEADSGLVGVMWDPLQKWDGSHYAPSPRFASPNFKDNQDNHLMGLFIPSTAQFVSENVPSTAQYVSENKDRATPPYALKANQKISLEAHIVAEASAGLLDILDHYLAVAGMPEKIKLPVTYDEALEIGRVGYMETLYDASAQGSKLWEGSRAYPSPGACSVLWRLYLDAKDPARKKMIRDRVELMVNKALENEGEKGLTDWLDDRHENFSKYFPASCGVRTHMLPFYIGHLEGGLAAWKKRVYDECINTQRADGSWEYLGCEIECVKQGDEVVIGTMTVLTGSILKYARVTGDQRALEAGMKALKYMERFTVPRGVNTWEVPKYTPDIQAAGLAIWCYLEAYQISGDPEHLERAKYWARTGVPFVYLWQAPNRAIMTGGTVAVFGATYNFQNLWIGRPVQWCGMPYGYWTLKLAEYDQSLPWRAIGREILDCGIQQMLRLPAHRRGTYADSIDIVGNNNLHGPAFEPEMLMKSIFLLRGHGVEVDTKVLNKGSKRIHVSTGAVLKSAELTRGSRSVDFELEYPADEISYAVVVGVSSNVKIEKDGRVLDRTDDLEAAGEGWKINADGLLLLKLKQDQPLVRINVTSR